MARRMKKIMPVRCVFAGAVVVFCFAGVVTQGCLPAYFAPVPIDLREKRILSGGDFLRKSTFIELPDLSHPFDDVTCIHATGSPEEDSNVIAVFHGHTHAYFIEPSTAQIQSTVILEHMCGGKVFVDVEGDGSLEIMCRGGGFADVGLYDADGALLWIKTGSEQGSPPFWMSAGDLDGDGVLEFCVAFWGSLACFNAEGEEQWRVAEDRWYYHVEVMTHETDQTRRGVVSLTCPARSCMSNYTLKIFDAQGVLAHTLTLPSDITGEFRLINWPPDTDSPSILTRTGTEVFLWDMNGELILEYHVPLSAWQGHGIEGVVVQMGKGTDVEPYLAMRIGAWGLWDRSLLVLLSRAGQVVYEEILSGETGLLATQLENLEGSADVLLVGDSPGTVVVYQPI